MIPSLDAHLIHLMGFRSNVRRMPFTELGCAAGAMALGRAADYLKAEPGGNVLIIAVELPSLTFQRKDISQANLISSILFGDGAAAVVVSGKAAARGPKILVSETYTFPDSLGAMGFDLRDSGFHILLAKDVPEMIGAKINELVDGFLERCGKKREDIKGWILHPGGARLLGNVETQLGLTTCQTQPSWDILANVGNLSSATILFILQEWLEKRPLKAGNMRCWRRLDRGSARNFCCSNGHNGHRVSGAAGRGGGVADRGAADFAAAQASMIARGRFQGDGAALWLDGGAAHGSAGRRGRRSSIPAPAIYSHSGGGDRSRCFLGANAVRWWVIRTLGEHWNVQVMDSTRLGVIVSGPFRFVRHPNYAAVFAEMLALPLIHTAWITALAGSLAHIAVLAQRLSTEERVLFADPDYRSAMARKPRFLPGLF